MYQWQRLIEIHRLLSSGKVSTPEQLKERFGVSRRQIFLDRKRLIEDLGAPLVHDRKRGGWIYSDLTWGLPITILTEPELLAFYLSLERTLSSDSLGAESPLHSAMQKLKIALGEPASTDLNALAQVTFARPPVATDHNDNFTAIGRAIAARRKVRLKYRTGSSGQVKTRVVHPYHRHEARGEGLFFGFDELRGRRLTFSTARIVELKILDAHFQIPGDFDARVMIDSMLWAEAGERIYEIAIHFDEYQARFTRERIYHTAQSLEELPDGELILRFPASGLAEVARFVLGFGCHAQVLEPVELRDLVVTHIEKLTRIYQENSND